MKVGLILEGGGVRGIYTAGVLDVFLEHGIQPDGVIGVSAGAIHACSYLSGQKGRSIRYYKKYIKDPRFMSLRSFIRTGNLVGTDFCYHELPDRLDVYDHDAFMACGIPFYVVCSNLKSGKAEYLRVTDLREQIDVIRASASMPYVSRIVEIGKDKYLDGGCTDSIPLEAFCKMGYGRSIVVLTRDATYRKKAEFPWLTKWMYRAYPAFVQAQLNRHTVYNRTLERILELERRGEIFVIRPTAPLSISRTEKDPERVEAVYQIGRVDGERAMEALKSWLVEQKKKEYNG